MSDEDSRCQRCQDLDIILTKKEDEIQKLKLKIKKLAALLLAHENKSKSCQYSSFSSEPENLIHGIVGDRQALSTGYTCGVPDEMVKSGNASNPKEAKSAVDITREKHPYLACHGTSEGKLDASDGPAGGNHSNEFNQHINEEEYVYDESLKMYYSISTGFYYDRSKGLFYVPQHGAYYKYDYSNNTYELYKNEQDIIVANVTEAACESVVDRVNGLNINEREEGIKDSSQEAADALDISNNDTQVEHETSTKLTLTISCVKNEDISISCSSPNDWQPPEGSNATVGDLVREVAEQNSGMSDYIYDEASQMYYCKSTGYFYDPIKRLLYDPKHRVYYLYDQETLSYDFYCHADSDLSPKNRKFPLKVGKDVRKKITKAKSKRKEKQALVSEIHEEQFITGQDVLNNQPKNVDVNFSSSEDGEIFSTDSEPESSNQSESSSTEQSISSVCLPCIRAIVESSQKLKVGTLLLITCSGGIMGRDKSNAVFIPDISVSKAHAEVKFNNESLKYGIEDLGSQNGTFLNELRLSEPKHRSEPHILKHGDRLSLGSCKLLLHIHNGYETCDKCEPGQVMAELSSQTASRDTPAFKTKEDKEKERKRELRQLKKKYGLQGADYTNTKNLVPPAGLGYEDKAEIRRKTVGSENPYEKTQVASLDVSVHESNKGYQMLKKLGWKEGESLGPSGSGISQPIPFRPWVSKAGLGSTEAEAAASSAVREEDRRKKIRWVKACERYFRLNS